MAWTVPVTATCTVGDHAAAAKTDAAFAGPADTLSAPCLMPGVYAIGTVNFNGTLTKSAFTIRSTSTLTLLMSSSKVPVRVETPPDAEVSMFFKWSVGFPQLLAAVTNESAGLKDPCSCRSSRARAAGTCMLKLTHATGFPASSDSVTVPSTSAEPGTSVGKATGPMTKFWTPAASPGDILTGIVLSTFSLMRPKSFTSSLASTVKLSKTLSSIPETVIVKPSPF
mmetsp:Transcript_56056/g.145784  ORF Transcript_56056/g.145784 Transcript_56056/m.145784 type:complete len:225 (-) Transcript_56056:209-883(-)